MSNPDIIEQARSFLGQYEKLVGGLSYSNNTQGEAGNLAVIAAQNNVQIALSVEILTELRKQNGS